jgi:peptidoglycan biosynthesis protein MviN/MurJ (putative lipid II flippase)
MLFVISIVSVIINIFLCQRYGGVGCAAGTAIAVLIGNVIIMGIYNQRKVGLNTIGLYKSIAPLIPALAPAIIAGIIINRFVNLKSIQNFLLSGMVYTCLYLRSMWISGLNEYEKNLLMRPMRMLLKRRA